jgi:hypothetical protein
MISSIALVALSCSAFQAVADPSVTTALTCEVGKNACIKVATPELVLGDTGSGQTLEGDLGLHVHGNTNATLTMQFKDGHCLRAGNTDPVIAYALSIADRPPEIITSIPNMTRFDSGNDFGKITKPVDGIIKFHVALAKDHFTKATPNAPYAATITFTITEGASL